MTTTSTATATATATPTPTLATSVEAAGTTFHVDDTGGDGVPIVALHSLFLDGRMFDDFASAARGEFRVVRPDFRGQGRSAPATGAVVTIEQNAGDIAAVLDRMGIERAHVVASSMGGDVAIRLAAMRPDLVLSLVFVGSSARPEPPEQLDAFRAWVDDAGQRGFTAERLDFVVQIMFGESTRTDPAQREMVERWRQRFAELPTSLKPAMLGVVVRHDGVPLLADIEARALVISGEECPVRPPEWARELADGLRHAELVMLPRVGHSPLLEAPVVTTERVLAFLRSHDPT
jgi:pimeloyl-ACP methyl ester carboxylesterase